MISADLLCCGIATLLESNKFFSKMPEQLAPPLHSGILLAAISAVVLNAYFNGFKEAKEEGVGEVTGRSSMGRRHPPKTSKDFISK